MARNIFHITWVTHNSRVSERMKEHNVHVGNPEILAPKDEIEIARYISEIADKDKLKILALNICRDHVHMLLVCEDDQRDSIVRKIKSQTARKYFQSRSRSEAVKQKTDLNRREIRSEHLWAQKYNWRVITDEDGLGNVYEYVKYNRVKHNLPTNKELEWVIEGMITPIEDIG